MRFPAVLVDVALHVAVAFAAGAALTWVRDQSSTLDMTSVATIAFVLFPVVSLIHRVVVQRFWHTTVGKRLFGLEMIRSDADRPLTLGYLLKWWVVGILSMALDTASPEDEDGAPRIVRRTVNTT